MRNKLGIFIVAMLLASVMFQIAVAATSKDSWLSKANMPSIREGLTVTEVAGKTYVIDGAMYITDHRLYTHHSSRITL